MMLSYQCNNCGAQMTVNGVLLDCPFCHVNHYQRMQDRLYEDRKRAQAVQSAKDRKGEPHGE
jgi:predicted  nucleic acid-binding Zn-ribbon protein